MANINGTQDDDILKGTEEDDKINGLGGNDRINGMAGDDALNGNLGNDVLNGREGDDDLNGNDGDDFLKGYTGNDRLSGGAGEDRLKGGLGDDVLTGGLGRDILNGGDQFGSEGADTFVFTSAEDSLVGAQRDVISHFDQGQDLIQLAAGLDFGSSAFNGKLTIVDLVDAGNNVVSQIAVRGNVAFTAADFSH